MGDLAFTVTAPGVQICSESFGTPRDTPLVLLHGAGNSMTSWDDQLVQLLVDKGFHTVRVDSRDAGRSTSSPIGAPEYSLEDMAKDVATVIRTRHLEAAVVAGVSMGAAVAQILALDHPDLISALCLISSTPGVPGVEDSDLAPMISPTGPSTDESPTTDPRWDDRNAIVRFLIDAERPYGGTVFDEELAERTAIEGVAHSLDLQAQLTNPYLVDAGRPWRSRLDRITAPTLVVHGSEDLLFPPDHGQALAAEIPGASLLILEGVGHANIPPLYWPELVNGIAALRTA